MIPFMPAIMMAGGGWNPFTADGTAHLIVRPEGTKYTTTGRTVLTTGTGNVGSATDESAQANHIEIASSLPTRTAGGGITFAGNYLRTKNVMGTAFAGDFLVGVATKLTTPGIEDRYLDCQSINGYILGQANNGGGLNKVNSIVVDTSPPYGLELAATDGVFHGFVDSRIGTTHDLRIDGTLAGTETVPSSSFGSGSYLYVSADGPGVSYSMYGDIYEILIFANPSTRDILGMASYFAARNTAGIYV